jgi:hypothetical protein
MHPMHAGIFVPQAIAKCPECGGELAARAMAFTASDTPIASSIELDCMNDLRDGKPCHKWYQSTWQPIRDAVVKWCGAKVERPEASHSFKMQGLSSTIFKSDQVESMCKAASAMSRQKLEEMFCKLCLSHERLQQELEGVDAMLADEKAYSSEKRAELR